MELISQSKLGEKHTIYRRKVKEYIHYGNIKAIKSVPLDAIKLIRDELFPPFE